MHQTFRTEKPPSVLVLTAVLALIKQTNQRCTVQVQVLVGCWYSCILLVCTHAHVGMYVPATHCSFHFHTHMLGQLHMPYGIKHPRPPLAILITALCAYRLMSHTCILLFEGVTRVTPRVFKGFSSFIIERMLVRYY